MSWSSIVPTIADFGADARFLNEYLEQYNIEREKLDLDPVDAITGVFLVEAKATVLRDLQRSLGLNPADESDMATIDLVVDSQEAAMQYAIALQQIMHAYSANLRGEESIESRRLRVREREYLVERAGFAGLITRRGNTTTSVIDFYC